MVTARSRALLLAPVVGAALLLSACGDPTGQARSGAGDQGSTAAPSTALSTAPTAVPTTVPTTVPPTGTGPSGGGGKQPGPPGIPVGTGKPITVEGVVESGVEPGCKILTAGAQRYLVLTSLDVPLGVPVVIEGVLQPGVLSTCQQGTPLRVTSVKRR